MTQVYQVYEVEPFDPRVRDCTMMKVVRSRYLRNLHETFYCKKKQKIIPYKYRDEVISGYVKTDDVLAIENISIHYYDNDLFVYLCGFVKSFEMFVTLVNKCSKGVIAKTRFIHRIIRREIPELEKILAYCVRREPRTLKQMEEYYSSRSMLKYNGREAYICRMFEKIIVEVKGPSRLISLAYRRGNIPILDKLLLRYPQCPESIIILKIREASA